MKSIINFFNKPLLKVPMAFGVLAGVVCFVYFFIIQNLEKISATARNLDIGFFLIFVGVACWYYRKNIRNGYLHLWEAITIGYVVWLTGALLCGYLIFVFFSLSPASFTAYQNKMRNYLLANKVDAIKVWGKEIFERKLNELSQVTPSSFIFDELRFTVLGVILGVLIIALIFRKQDYGLMK